MEQHAATTPTHSTGEQAPPAVPADEDGDSAVDPMDPSVDWSHIEASISWEYPTSESDSTFHANGAIADRVLLDGTIEHLDEDGTLTHVTLDDGSTILINGDPDHSYVVHRRLAEFAYEAHQLSHAETSARFAELSPALYDPDNAIRIAWVIAKLMADDDLYEAELQCEAAAQQHALSAWMLQHPLPRSTKESVGANPSTLEEAQSMRDTLLQVFDEQCQGGALPVGPSYIPAILIDHRWLSLTMYVRNVPDATMRNRYDRNETLSPVREELRSRVEAICNAVGLRIERVHLESDLERGIRRLGTHSRHLHEWLGAA